MHSEHAIPGAAAGTRFAGTAGHDRENASEIQTHCKECAVPRIKPLYSLRAQLS